MRTFGSCLGLFVLFSLNLFVQSIIIGRECETPLKIKGTCQPLNQCTSIPVNNTDYIRKSTCGLQKGQRIVCCPDARKLDNFPDDKVCGLSTQVRITGGVATDIDEFPWLVLLRYRKPNGQITFNCGGTLITSKHILTAAHCVKNPSISRGWTLLSVRLGEYNTKNTTDCVDGRCSDPPQDIQISSSIPHPDYRMEDKSNKNDIAILVMKQSVHYSTYIMPVCLPFRNYQLAGETYLGHALTVSGWGRTETKSTSDVKLKVKLEVQENSVCEEKFKLNSIILNEKQMCIGGETGKDSCRGDSGGPIMQQSINDNGRGNWYVIGIVSFGALACGSTGVPGIYTKVQEYNNWIVDNVDATS